MHLSLYYTSTPETPQPPVSDVCKGENGAMAPILQKIELLSIIETLWQLLNDPSVVD